MSFRINYIQRIDREDGYVWRLSIKGLRGEGIYFTAVTGSNGLDRYDLNAGNGLLEILPPSRFHAHAGCDANQVVQRVAAALAAIGWGPEIYADRESISDGRATRLRAEFTRMALGRLERYHLAS